jgi:hypothetical protein
MACPAWATPRFRAWVLAWTLISLAAYGLVTAIVPNPVFGRQVPPEPFAYAVWLLSGPLMGFVAATYSGAPTRAAGAVVARPLVPVTAAPADGRASTLGMAASFGTFLAIGCPVCNKIALLLLGTSGALSVWAPIQPFLGAASLALLAGTVAWRIRQMNAGTACAV